MKPVFLLALCLAMAAPSLPAQSRDFEIEGRSEPAASSPVASPRTPVAASLPPMDYVSTVASDAIFDVLKADGAFAGLEKGADGNPITLLVSHGTRATAGGMAAGLFSAILSGSTLGLLPVVSSDRHFIRYDVYANGSLLASERFEYTETRASSIWSADNPGAMGKAGLAWAEGTAREVAERFKRNPALLELRREMDVYFPPAPATPASGGALPVPPPPPAPPGN